MTNTFSSLSGLEFIWSRPLEVEITGVERLQNSHSGAPRWRLTITFVDPTDGLWRTGKATTVANAQFNFDITHETRGRRIIVLTRRGEISSLVLP